LWSTFIWFRIPSSDKFLLIKKEILGSVEAREFLDQLNGIHLLSNDSTACSYARSETLLLFNLSSQRLGFSARILYIERVVGENGTGSEFYRVLWGACANHNFDNDLCPSIITPDKYVILET
jgi:hypothetical protein